MKINISIGLDITKDRLHNLGFIYRTEIHSVYTERDSYVLGNFKLDTDGYHDQIIYIPTLKIIREHWFANVGPTYREVKVETMKDVKNFLKDVEILDQRSDDAKKYGDRVFYKNGELLDVYLVDPCNHRVQVIRELSKILDINLIESKWIVDSAPVKIKEKIDKDEASELKSRLEEIGAFVELQ